MHFGILKPDEQLPSIRDLATTLGINPNTVKKSYELLEKNGSIVIISTKGTFVATQTDLIIKRKEKEIFEKIMLEIKELESLGMAKKKIIEKLELIV